MKTIFCISILLLSFSGLSQIKKAEPRRAIVIKEKVALPVRAKTLVVNTNIFGNFEITKFSILSTNTLPKKELSVLVGSLIKVSETAITGTEIDPFNFEIYDIEKMNSSDYIFREFGRSIRAPEPNLPAVIKVHKTDFEGCYGIVEISKDQIAIPYNGVLLFLKRK